MKKAIVLVLLACAMFAMAACTYTPTSLRPVAGSDRGAEMFKDRP
jgi:hypothetical protein